MVTKDRIVHRARRPEQKAVRRADLLDAAASLLAVQRFEDISVSSIGEAAELAKGTMYRYFASKEELFLALLERELTRWTASVTARLDDLPEPASPTHLASTITASVSGEPILVKLVTILPGVLEQNLTDAAALEFKRFLATAVGEVGAAVERVDHQLPVGSGSRVVLFLSAAISGLWPMAHPAPPVDRALANEEVSHLRVEFDRDLNGILRAVIDGMRTQPKES